MFACLCAYVYEQIMAETLQYWKDHVNVGFLKYRKSVADGSSFAALDWKDGAPGSAWFFDHRGKKYIDLLGGFGIYNVGRRYGKKKKNVREGRSAPRRAGWVVLSFPPPTHPCSPPFRVGLLFYLSGG